MPCDAVRRPYKSWVSMFALSMHVMLLKVLARLTDSLVCFIVGRSGVVLVINEITPADDRRDVHFAVVACDCRSFALRPRLFRANVIESPIINASLSSVSGS